MSENITKARGKRLGLAGYVSFLAALPGTTAEIQERTGLCSNTVNKLLREFHALHIVYWKASVKSSIPRAGHVVVWGVGDLPDCQHSRPVPQIRPRAASIAFATVVRALKTPVSIPEMHRETGVTEITLRALIKELRKHSLCHVGEWRRQHGSPVKLHVWGNGWDAKRPRPLTRSQINAKQNAIQSAKRKHLKMIRATAGNDARMEQAA